MNFADQLRAARRRDDYTQAMAVKLIPGLSLRTFQAWERGQQEPPVWAQNLVLEVLGGKTYQSPKKRKPRRLGSVAVALGVLLILGMASADTHAATQAWTRWEHPLTSTKTYADPVAEVTLKVTYRGPDQQTITGLGFWDGGTTFKLRCLFPKPGQWAWETSCSDTANAGLHAQRGSIEVVPYAGENRLYRHGCLRVSENHRYLTHADGKPFLWIGDTAWAAPMNAMPAHGFTGGVVMSAISRTDRAGRNGS